MANSGTVTATRWSRTAGRVGREEGGCGWQVMKEPPATAHRTGGARVGRETESACRSGGEPANSGLSIDEGNGPARQTNHPIGTRIREQLFDKIG